MNNRLLKRVLVPGTDLDIPYATVGVMMFGGRTGDAEAMRIVDAALDRGANYFDTANTYNAGESERVLGRALRGRRDRCVVATKVGYGRGPDGKAEGLSRQAILRAIDQSLANLGIDCVDVYFLHRPDKETPIAETLAAIDEIRRAGKIRYFGISNFGGWQTYEVMRLCESHGWQRPVMSQMIYNALVRQIELEYVSLRRREEFHLTVYNPLAGGLLTGKYASLSDEGQGGRFQNNPDYRKRYWSERCFRGMLGLKAIADELGMSLTHLALDWIAQQSIADSILLGPSSLEQLLDCLAAGERTIPPEGMRKIASFLEEYEGTNAAYAR
ncbi:MAG: L-glyceraldehyde 3-phosphate reductase [candidate division BRC1 bacterium ADurb.BinA364]|nr:MAG: L-glyceraldehyde 3-phosphate reductase [candidate division BRC1 bacterium ADurb.BinA364]